MNNTIVEVVNENTIVEVVNENTIVEVVDEYIDVVEVGIQGPPGTGMPAGGLTDDVLTKKSDANYDYMWRKFKTVLEKHDSITEEELRDSLLWNNTATDSIQYYDGSAVKTLLYSEGSRSDQVLSGSSLPNGNLILKSTSAEEKGSIIIPEFNSAGIIVSDELGHISTTSQLSPENIPSHSSPTTEFGVADKESYGHVKIGSSITVDNGVIDIDINTGRGLEYTGETPNKILEIDDTVVTLSDNQVLLNKTLESPILESPILESPVIHSEDSIVDEYGNELLTFKAVTYAKNNVAVENARVAEGPRIYPVGENDNIDLLLSSKGYGSVKVNDDIVTTNTKFQVLTNKVLTDNVAESIYPREDRVNKLYLPDVTDTLVTLNAVQTLTNKTLTTPKFVNHGYIADSNGNELVVFNSYESAVNAVTIENAPELNSPIIKASGDDINIDLVLRAKGTGSVRVNDDVITTNNANQTLINKVLLEPVVSSLYQDLEKTNRITFPGVSDTVVTLNAVQTLTNKTLTAPKFANNGYIADINDNELLTFNSHDSAVNNIVVENAVITDSPIIRAAGEDIDVDLILKAKGIGSVRVDNDIITTNSAVQTLTNKILFEPIIGSLYQDSEKNNKITFPEISDTVVTLNAVQTLTNKILTTPRIINNDYIADLNGNKLLMFGSTPSAETYLKLTNNTAGNNTILEALGSMNTGLDIVTSGTGTVRINNDVVTTNTASQTLTHKTLTEPTIGNFVNANHNHSNNVNGGQITDAALSSPVTPAKGGTGFSSYTLGDIIFAVSTDTLNKLPGNTTTDTKLLTQTGTGTESSTPEWKKYKHEQVIGDGVSSEYTINHNLNTRAHTISVWRNAPPYDEIDYYVEKTTPNTVTLYFSRVLQQDEFSTVIIG